MNLEDLQVCELAMELGENVWTEVIQWDYFAKDAVGRQLTKAADSVASNISEGFGRYYYKENKQFFTMPEIHCTKPSRGSPRHRIES